MKKQQSRLPSELERQIENAQREVKEYEARGMTGTYWHDVLARLEKEAKQYESESESEVNYGTR